MTGITMLDRAFEVLHLAEAEPARAVGPAAELRRQAIRARDQAALSVTERALGIAALHVQDADLAVRHLRRAITAGQRAGAPDLVTEARLRLVMFHNLAGRPGPALREIEAALRDTQGLERARAFAQQGAVLLQLGRLDAALESFERALPALRAANDVMWLKRVLANRGIVLTHRLRFSAAEADLQESLRINSDLGIGLSVAFVEQNLGWLDAMRGEVPAALEHLDRAGDTLERLGAQTGFLLQDRATLLLSAGLVAEAVTAAEGAVAALAREHQRVAIPDVRLLLARALLARGDPDAALDQARRAAAALARQDRPEVATFARFVVAACRAAGQERSRIALAPLRDTADRLAAAGWPDAAVEARLLLAELASERGVRGPAREQLRTAARSRFHGPAAVRATGWRAHARLHLDDGRTTAALGALRAGLRVLDENRARLGAADLRVHTGLRRAGLARDGLRVAVAAGRPATVFAWAEQARASALLLPALRAPDDEHLARDLAELRAVARDLEEARTEGRDPAPALRRQVVVERRIRDRTRRRQGTAAASGSGRDAVVSLPALTTALGSAALVEYVELDGDLAALTVVGHRTRWVPLGSASVVAALVDRLAFALRRLAAGRGRPGAARALFEDTARRLDDHLLVPVRDELTDRPLVAVPVGALQSLPWSVLPSCRGRAVTVAPSATTWWRATLAAGTGSGQVLAVAGPGLAGAAEEAVAVAGAYGVEAITGADAGVDGVLTGLAGADVAHLAAHGTVHPEHPLFSALRLADGPLTGYDLERLDPVPRLTVLAACESGRHTLVGDELLGLTTTLLARGATQVVASVIPAPDAATVPLMTAFHERVAAGTPSSQALGLAQAELAGSGDDAELAAAAGFVCIGGEFRFDGAQTNSASMDVTFR